MIAPMFIRFDRIHERDRHTNRQTDIHRMTAKRSVDRRYLSYYRNSVKKYFLTQKFTETRQLAGELWQKNI